MQASTETTTHLTHTVIFEKKVSDGNYGINGASFLMQFDTPLGTDPVAIMEQAANFFMAAKVQVYAELGLDYTSIADAGVQTNFAAEIAPDQLTQVVEQFPGAQVVQQAPPQQAAPQQVGVAAVPPFSSDTRVASEKAANTAWGWQRFAVAPQEFFDNRQKKANGEYKATSPDLKHKDSGTPIWPAA